MHSAIDYHPPNSAPPVHKEHLPLQPHPQVLFLSIKSYGIGYPFGLAALVLSLPSSSLARQQESLSLCWLLIVFQVRIWVYDNCKNEDHLSVWQEWKMWVKWQSFSGKEQITKQTVWCYSLNLWSSHSLKSAVLVPSFERSVIKLQKVGRKATIKNLLMFWGFCRSTFELPTRWGTERQEAHPFCIINGL